MAAYRFVASHQGDKSFDQLKRRLLCHIKYKKVHHNRTPVQIIIAAEQGNFCYVFAEFQNVFIDTVYKCF